jgi:hypothetical protein
MIRRRRRTREIPFSFDSFLDVVANVVGIIIRLILVVWVGARSYTTVQTLLTQRPAVKGTNEVETPLPADPMEQELDRHRLALAQAQARLLEQLSHLQDARRRNEKAQSEWAPLTAQGERLANEQAMLDRQAAASGQVAGTAALSLAQLRERERRVQDQLRELERLPPLKHVVHYRTPVSQPVNNEEYMFECRAGRVSFVDTAAMLAEIRRGLQDKAQLLRTRWKVSDESGPAGAFRLRYTVERERNLVDALDLGAPEATATFRYGLTEWVVEPIASVRGEALTAALAPGSDFRRVVDYLDPRQAVATFWVYPDSFALFRGLREYLYTKELIVAGRPLPEGMPITCSRQGSLSRGQ